MNKFIQRIRENDPYISAVRLGCEGIKDITFLRGNTNVKVLSVTRNDVEDLGPLEKNRVIIDLNADYCKIWNLAPLSWCANLKYLTLCNNRIDNIDALSTLHSLTFLGLSHNIIEDISPLASLKKLKSLDVSCNRIESINEVVKGCNLHTLFVVSNFITDVSSMFSNTKLTSVCLHGNPLLDFHNTISHIDLVCEYNQYNKYRRRYTLFYLISYWITWELDYAL